MYRSHREVWISVKRGMSFALSDGFAPVAFVIQEVWMGKRTLRFIELKMWTGLPMTKSEHRFFGGPRRFKHDVLRVIKDHWLT